MPLDRQQARRLALANGAVRSALGVTALVAPALPLSPWVGAAGDTQASRMLARALGGRDLALAAGVLMGLRRDAAVRGWLEASALADAVDAIVTLGAFSSLPRRGRWAVLVAAAAGVAAGVVAARAVDKPARTPERPDWTAPGVA